MKAVFVTGTDTGVGKSIVSGLLGRYLSDRGYRVITQKWIQTGSEDLSQDIDLHLELMGKKREDIEDYISFASPYTFGFPSSPHLAAQLEKRPIDIEKIKRSFRFLQSKFDFVVAEGIGGALVPLSERRLVIDVAKELDLPVMVVAGNKLGAINHTLLTIESLRRRGMKVIGIIFNNLNKETDEIILEDNLRIIGNITQENILGVLPFSKDNTLLCKAFIPIGERVLAQLKER